MSNTDLNTLQVHLYADSFDKCTVPLLRKKSVDKWTLEWKPTLFRASTVKPFLTLKDKEVNFGLINNS